VKDSYYNVEHGVTLHLMKGTKASDLSRPIVIMTEVQTQRMKRGYGYASAVLREMLADADAEGVTVMLSVESDNTPGSMSNANLITWYWRYGFRILSGDSDRPAMIRQPQSTRAA
jgi:hypothetical protein